MRCLSPVDEEGGDEDDKDDGPKDDNNDAILRKWLCKSKTRECLRHGNNERVAIMTMLLLTNRSTMKMWLNHYHRNRCFHCVHHHHFPVTAVI